MKLDKKQLHFTKKEIAAAAQIWGRAAISLLDIRHNLIPASEPLCCYRLPASAFVYASGSAEISLNDAAYSVDRFGLFHGGKGTELSIHPCGGWLEYYMVLYKATEPAAHKREYTRLLEQTNPFRQQYGFSPANPLLFADQLKQMFEYWNSPTPLNLFYEKGAFYQFVYAVYAELERDEIQIFEPDAVTMAVRYLNKHYGKNVAIQELCEMLGISYSHFHRSFKQKVGSSPQEYLIHTRLEAAIKMLETSGASMREIAVRCGLGDEQGLYRLFKNKTGVSPSLYRENLYTRMRDDALQNNAPFAYNKESQVRLGELQEKGATYMLRQIRSKAVVAAALSLMLLLSACSAPSSNSSSVANTSSVASQTAEVEETAPAEQGTKTIKMEYGDVEIPADPQRVVVIFVQGDLLALGVTPVGTSFNSGSAFEGKAQETTVIDAFSINEEEILALDPDLIIWNTEDEQTYQKLSKIAPTLATDYFGMDYQERLRFFGEIFNRSEKAEELIAGFEEKLETAKSELKDANLLDKSVICVDVRDGFLRAFTGGRGGPLVYDFIGFSLPEKLKAAAQTEEFEKTGSLDLSYEVMPEFVGDYILLNTSADKLMDNAVWNNLPAVKEGRVIRASTDMFWFNDIISLSTQLDIIVDAVLGSQS